MKIMRNLILQVKVLDFENRIFFSKLSKSEQKFCFSRTMKLWKK